MLTTTQAAERLGVTDVHYVRRLIKDGKLKATKYGRDWLIEEADIETYKSAHPRGDRGRPRKEQK